jgi:hypothetical protein
LTAHRAQTLLPKANKMINPGVNSFSIDYYKSILSGALKNGYRFFTMRDFVAQNCPSGKIFLLRHDLDTKPRSLLAVLEAEKELGVRSTIFARAMANDYNLLGYEVLPMLLEAERDGFEIGLHTNFVESGIINGIEPRTVLEAEINLLKSFFQVSGVACHRDINYMHNSLPWLVEHWDDIRMQNNLVYQAYEDRFVKSCTYVNEGLSPHLGWRTVKPEQIISQSLPICLLTHSHWWYKKHAFEIA